MTASQLASVFFCDFVSDDFSVFCDIVSGDLSLFCDTVSTDSTSKDSSFACAEL